MFLKKAPVIAIPNEKREMQKKLEITPGPSHYRKEYCYKPEGPKFVIGIKSHYDVTGAKKRTTPGVGAYNVNESAEFSASIKQAPRCSFGKEKRKGIPIKTGPAPNQYAPSQVEKWRAPRPFIAQSLRLGSAGSLGLKKGRSMTSLKSGRAEAPGPGAYYLPTTFANSKGYDIAGSAAFQKV